MKIDLYIIYDIMLSTIICVESYEIHKKGEVKW